MRKYSNSVYLNVGSQGPSQREPQLDPGLPAHVQEHRDRGAGLHLPARRGVAQFTGGEEPGPHPGAVPDAGALIGQEGPHREVVPSPDHPGVPDLQPVLGQQ